jgi:hypothetical protein
MSTCSEALARFPAGGDARSAEGSAMVFQRRNHARMVAWWEASVAPGQLAARAITAVAGDSSTYLCFHVRMRSIGFTRKTAFQPIHALCRQLTKTRCSLQL